MPLTLCHASLSFVRTRQGARCAASLFACAKGAGLTTVHKTRPGSRDYKCGRRSACGAGSACPAARWLRSVLAQHAVDGVGVQMPAALLPLAIMTEWVEDRPVEIGADAVRDIRVDGERVASAAFTDDARGVEATKG